ncbi:M14 family metallocarboxypeptidase [Alkalimonas sp.]|uniref:M14 family metallopeptidase n=1 Tax=Alkalimonas sp. TaxID=1872453 RepID=UPI00263BD8D6|nr:M14 family metallocarboxypeptidase [Alkalimonas sp.]MCC5825893.1 M14 family metallocarboxypeptidase [Alkalimonas sp.]
MTDPIYAIGTVGTPWGQPEKTRWLSQQQIKRSYQSDVLSQLNALQQDFDVEQYGRLDYRELVGADYPLFAVKSRHWDPTKPSVLVTGGVHGYETSGVHGALAFLRQQALSYSQHFNLLVLPCLSPWGYETINRWNPEAVDPNRSFITPSPAPESAQAMQYVQSVTANWLAHIDLHETTDSDNSEFRPAKAARDGTVNTNWNIPDGFYLVGDTKQPAPAFQQAIIEEVAKVTHIAEPDEQGCLIGEPLVQPGVILYDTKGAGLCAGMTDAAFVTTTEVYPDSPRSTPEICVLAQQAAICGALDHLLNQH